ncbi:DUF3519 domain-containing protein, partial [Helicobacter pylori]|uniref:DUF3519 domain-containing protein n=1 Tax=Helicobacter pylori TaxID=210 RepID=UPI001968FF30
SLRNSIEWLSNAGMRLKNKMKEYESFFNDFNTSMKANEQEVTDTLNANTENIKSEIKKLENQIIETATRLLTSYQIFLNNAKESATTQINETEAKEYAMSVVKTIPEVIEKGVKVERNGRMAIEYQNIRVGLKDNWKGEKLKSRWVITSFEKKVGNLREQAKFIDPSLITKDGEHLASSLNSVEPNSTTNMLKKQTPLSEQANAKKLAKLENEKGIKAEAVKKLNFDEIKKLIDESPNNGKDIIVIGEDNLMPEIVEYIHKKHAKVGIERLDEDEITVFNFTYPKNAKAIIDYQGIQHALNKHGINSPSVKFSKQPPITYKDIANYRNIVKNADETIKRDNRIISYKQVNGHFVVVEQINRNKSEFIFKTMFKEKGDYKNAPDYEKNIKEND